MSGIAIGLLVISASIHAGWNLVCKRQHPSQGFFLLAGLAGVILLMPVAIIYHGAILQIPVQVWRLLFLTGCCFALYYLALAGAYRKGDMSIAYPLARSSSILMVMVVSLTVGREHDIGGGAVVGMGLVMGGSFLLPMGQFTDFHARNYLNSCCGLALLAAAGTAGYTIIDDWALAILRDRSDSLLNPMAVAFIYVFLENLCALVWQGVVILATPGEYQVLIGSCRRQIKAAAIAGTGIVFAYGLSLTAMAFVSNVSYVAAFRQLSIPIGTVLGRVLLQEPCPAPRLLGTAIILVGLILV
ncbi:MAG: hypothetical protein KGQ93_13860, partial [Cyanobacteria bacterium REEB459]|nr:hypothetical protein [Cyanobacteria bacterium REEB459]